MMKQLILFLFLAFSVSCAQNTIHSQQQTTTAQETPMPTVMPTPFTFPKLSNSDARRLDERLPKKVRRILEQAEKIEMFEIAGYMEARPPKSEQNQPERFQDFRIKKKVTITDASLKQQILDGLFYAASTSDSGAMCFSPAHGVRATYKGESVDLVICFMCGNFRGESSVGRVGGAISKAPKELFEQVLANAKEN